MGVFVLLGVLSVPNAIHYIEDPDSLRFAMATREFAPERGWPHFPLYPLFVMISQGFTKLFGSFAYAFSFIGAISHFVIIYFGVDLVPSKNRWIAFLLLLVTPMIWIMSSRYMPDLMGTAIVIAMYRYGLKSDQKLLVGVLMSALLLVRLSYFPLMIPLLFNWSKRDRTRWAMALSSLVAVIILTLTIGWDVLWEIGMKQTQGHFTDFGGTLNSTSFGVLDRLERFFHYWTYNALGWNSDWIVLSAAAMVLTGLVLSFSFKSIEKVNHRIWWGILLYLIWAFFFQNVVYKFRHLLPLIPLLIIVLSTKINLNHWWKNSIIVALSLCWGVISFLGAGLHQQPTAISQIAVQLKEEATKETVVISSKLLNFTVENQGVEAQFLDLEELSASDYQMIQEAEKVICIGDFQFFEDREPDHELQFKHNEWSNPMWAELNYKVYQ